MKEFTQEFTQEYVLQAGECNPEGEMPLTLLTRRIIEVATSHADSWGVGYERLIKDNTGWVLSRLTIELERYPVVGERYSLTTWIEDYNRHFSQRNMILCDGEGKAIGYVRSIWMVINFATRQGVDISQLSYISANVSPRQCPIEPQSRLRPLDNVAVSLPYTFAYCDCDFNRHVNTVRYIEHLLNLFPLSRFDSQMVRRMELAFLKETRYGDKVNITLADADDMDSRLAITDDEGNDHVRARLCWTPRQKTLTP